MSIQRDNKKVFFNFVIHPSMLPNSGSLKFEMRIYDTFQRTFSEYVFMYLSYDIDAKEYKHYVQLEFFCKC